MNEVAIISSVRSAIGKSYKGAFKETRPDTICAKILKEAVKRANLKPADIEDVVIGCATPEAEQGMNMARNISLLADMPYETSAATVNRFCSSGLHAIADVAKSINIGQIIIGVGGGVESMTMIPMGGHRLAANLELVEKIPTAYMPMGLTAEQVAEKFAINRQMQDEFSYQSHQKALKAQNSGWFDDEIVPIEVTFDKNTTTIKKDDGPRADTSFEALSKLRSVFKINGTVTAGNSSQLSDGAACCVLMNAKVAKDNGLNILGYFRDFVTAGVPPEIMGIGPIPAILKLLKKNNLSISDIGVFEINEAFAAQAYYCIKELKIDPSKVNMCGGAIALGHPLGCTGARQVATILRQMKRTKSRYGICSMCIGGGMGAAGLIEIV